MSWTVPRTWVTSEVLTKALLDEQLRDNLNFLKVNIALEAASELTIVTGEVTKTQSHHKIDTQDDDPSDDLDTINGGAEGEVLLIRAADDARTVVVKHGTGNIINPNGLDSTLDDGDDYLLLINDGTNWIMVGGVGTSITDHGGLTGLADDDHPQYTTDAEAIVWAIVFGG